MLINNTQNKLASGLNHAPIMLDFLLRGTDFLLVDDLKENVNLSFFIKHWDCKSSEGPNQVCDPLA